MVSKFDICSSALVELGEDTIASFIANTPSSKICGQIYPEYIKYLQSIHPWNFNFKKQQLARLVATPLNEWKYQYELPADMLILHAVYNSSNNNDIPDTRYEIFGSTIMTNEELVYIDYQYQVDEADFPPYFTEFVIKAVASKLARPITDDDNIVQYKKVEAFGSGSDNLNGGEFGMAKKLDSLQNPSTFIRADALAAARFR